jgi:hypothetical protein
MIYYSSLNVPCVENRFGAQKNFMGFIFGSLLISSECHCSCEIHTEDGNNVCKNVQTHPKHKARNQ